MAYPLLYPSDVEEECPVIDKPGVDVNVIIQIVIAGVIIWYLMRK